MEHDTTDMKSQVADVISCTVDYSNDARLRPILLKAVVSTYLVRLLKRHTTSHAITLVVDNCSKVLAQNILYSRL